MGLLCIGAVTQYAITQFPVSAASAAITSGEIGLIILAPPRTAERARTPSAVAAPIFILVKV